MAGGIGNTESEQQPTSRPRRRFTARLIGAVMRQLGMSNTSELFVGAAVGIIVLL